MSRPHPSRPLVAAALLALGVCAARAQSVPDLDDFHVQKVRPHGSQALAPAASVNLTSQFEADREQGQVGSCHAFAVVALLEAAYFRQYHRRIQLSEADLLVENTLGRAPADAPRAYAALAAADQCRLAEGNYPEDDITYALQHGVAEASVFPYETFLKRYLAWRDRPGGAGPSKDALVWKMSEPQQRAALRQYLEGADAGAIAASRERIRKALAGFKLDVKTFDLDTDPSRPVQDGGQQGMLLDVLSRRRIPLAVSMNIADCYSWSTKHSKYPTLASGMAGHAFVMVGYAYDVSRGAFLFHIRNSWGGIDPDIFGGELRRIYEIAALLDRNEAGPYGR